jgi:hypothetical protein
MKTMMFVAAMLMAGAAQAEWKAEESKDAMTDVITTSLRQETADLTIVLSCRGPVGTKPARAIATFVAKGSFDWTTVRLGTLTGTIKIAVRVGTEKHEEYMLLNMSKRGDVGQLNVLSNDPKRLFAQVTAGDFVAQFPTMTVF